MATFDSNNDLGERALPQAAAMQQQQQLSFQKESQGANHYTYHVAKPIIIKQ